MPDFSETDLHISGLMPNTDLWMVLGSIRQDIMEEKAQRMSDADCPRGPDYLFLQQNRNASRSTLKLWGFFGFPSIVSYNFLTELRCRSAADGTRRDGRGRVTGDMRHPAHGLRYS